MNHPRPDLDDPHAWPDKARRVRAMFDRIARTYTRVNSIISFGRDAHWRRRAVRLADPHPGERLLDCCCGPGELADAFLAAQPALGRVVGLDFSAGMIRMADARQASRRRRLELMLGDAMNLPFDEESFDLVSCAFGVRNLSDPAAGLAEFARVLAPGGRAVVLEFAMPRRRLMRSGYRLYFNRVLPVLGGLISGDRGAYAYLPRSVETFFQPGQIVDMLKMVGLCDIVQAPLTCGVAVVTIGRKPPRPETRG
ncbi:MAG: Demethylmenaquinone methyltransferase [Phycisphaerae bacterium]|nr:Demethylmenaquinone methyltransferase [Phycisphaerae bacterium]